ncbi:hypothetical protein H6F43_12585 [Leptolyngbya sp. FACHB-36]|uniref:hypothetical protein n=1 Tax=Leptolyngbya sp. FACHB-36 TaxID=2692808 RepID=UPI001680F63D|nr:hypothetical protein [Leptolyngbya sp. FACHB-36]MBD2021016.1 hypothetical protein [Leptolyngbya sp. FACHB-36]
MSDVIGTSPAHSTLQALDQAIQRYRTSDLTGVELFNHWEAIREVALEYQDSESEGDGVAAEHSY